MPELLSRVKEGYLTAGKSSSHLRECKVFRIRLFVSITIGRDGGNLGYFGGGGDSFGLSRQRIERHCRQLLESPGGGVATGGYIFYSFGVLDSTSEDGGCCRTIPSYFVCFLSDIWMQRKI